MFKTLGAGGAGGRDLKMQYGWYLERMESQVVHVNE